MAAHDLADRLRTLPESRLRRPVAADGETVAEAGLRVVQLLADLAAGIVGRDDAVRCVRRVPDLGAFAVSDQIAVTATDLAQVLADVAGDVEVWSPTGERTLLTALLSRARAEVDALTARA